MFTSAGHPGAMFEMVERLQRGLAHHRAGRLAEAECVYREVLAERGDEPHALHCLGLLALGTGRAAEALQLLSQAADIWPDHDGVRLAVGRALLAAGCLAEATAHFQAMSDARPLFAAPRASLALARLRNGDPEGAIRAAEAALALDGANSEAWFAHGSGLGQCRRLEPARASLERAVGCAPDHAEAHLNLGNVLFDLDRRAQAERHLRCATMLDPALAEAHASLGCLLSGDGLLDEAVAACTIAIDLRPGFAQAYWNRSFAHMLAGEYGPGWEDYEWRKRHDLFAGAFRLLDGPDWKGESISGRTLLVRAEQGLGDTIQFARYFSSIVALGAEVVLLCAPPLVRLLSQIAGVTVVSSAAPLPPYDVWVDQMSLPRLFATRADNIPCARSYLAAAPARVARWDALLAKGLRVGIVWAGNPAHSNDRRRSMSPDMLAALVAPPRLQRGDIRFVSLQLGPDNAEVAARYGLECHAAELSDLAETAALIAALDLVVSVDSCVAHLAGALGVPVWIMLPFAPDWRWMIGRTDSPWYESVRLFRQSRAGDWRDVIDAVVEQLAMLPETVLAETDLAETGRAAGGAAERVLRRRVSPSPRPVPAVPASRNRRATSPSPAPG